jgi:hypothetical protein
MYRLPVIRPVRRPAAWTGLLAAATLAGGASKTPGTILRSRPVNLAALGFLPQNVQAWQVLYRTTELVLIDTVVAKGFAVSIPDYEGPDGEFGAPDQPGYAILDGLRAAMKFHPLGLPGAGTPAAIWGYSGGSLVSGWAAQVQPSYAPDINLRGVAVGGLVTNLAQALTTVNGGIGAGLIPSVLPGVLRADPALATAIHPYLTEPLATVLALPAVQSAMAPLNLGGSAPAAPCSSTTPSTTSSSPPQGCTTTTVVSMLLIPPGLASLPSFLTAIVAALLDQPIGPGNIF